MKKKKTTKNSSEMKYISKKSIVIRSRFKMDKVYHIYIRHKYRIHKDLWIFIIFLVFFCNFAPYRDRSISFPFSKDRLYILYAQLKKMEVNAFGRTVFCKSSRFISVAVLVYHPIFSYAFMVARSVGHILFLTHNFCLNKF